MTAKTFRGVYYFETGAGAAEWAAAHGWPVAFIREYVRGFAVQACNLGRYAGPDQRGWPGPYWSGPDHKPFVLP